MATTFQRMFSWLSFFHWTALSSASSGSRMWPLLHLARPRCMRKVESKKYGRCSHQPKLQGFPLQLPYFLSSSTCAGPLVRASSFGCCFCSLVFCLSSSCSASAPPRSSPALLTTFGLSVLSLTMASGFLGFRRLPCCFHGSFLSCSENR